LKKKQKKNKIKNGDFDKGYFATVLNYYIK